MPSAPAASAPTARASWRGFGHGRPWARRCCLATAVALQCCAVGVLAAGIDPSSERAVALDDECLLDGSSECALSAVQLRGQRVVASEPAATAAAARLGAAEPELELERLAAAVRAEGGEQAQFLIQRLQHLSTLAAGGPEKPASLSLLAEEGPWAGDDDDEYDNPTPRRSSSAGELAGLYTFGSPGTARSPLRNVLQPNGTFPGLRVFAEERHSVLGLRANFHDPIAFAATVVGLKHPRMDTLVLEGGGTPPEYHRWSPPDADLPPKDLFFWIHGHQISHYVKQIKEIKESTSPYDSMVTDMAALARAVYPDIHPDAGSVAEAGRAAGWNLVARSISSPLTNDKDNLGMKTDIVKDYITLFQHPSTLACTVAFVGTHDVTQWLSNLDFRVGQYCGIDNVHQGFLEQVRRYTKAHDYTVYLKPSLNSCSKLYVTGHSLGAAQAELFAACVQRAPALGEPGWEDFEAIGWMPGVARALPPLVPAGGGGGA